MGGRDYERETEDVEIDDTEIGDGDDREPPAPAGRGDSATRISVELGTILASLGRIVGFDRPLAVEYKLRDDLGLPPEVKLEVDLSSGKVPSSAEDYGTDYVEWEHQGITVHGVKG